MFLYFKHILVTMRSKKILQAQDYMHALGNVIEREYFPDLSRIKSQQQGAPTSKRKHEVIDLTDSAIDEFHEKNVSTDQVNFRASQTLQRKHHETVWNKVASSGKSSTLALRLDPNPQVTSIPSSRPMVRRENTRLIRSDNVRIDASVEGMLSAKSIIQQSTRRSERMVESGQFFNDGYSLPPTDPREQVAIKLEESVSKDILRAGLRKK